MTAIRSISSLVFVALISAACSASGASPATSAAPVTQGSAPAGAGAVSIGTGSTASLGTVLTGANGMTLYAHAGDSSSASTCTGGCATAWPPLTVSSGAQAIAGPGVTGQLGTLMRSDGTTQVTYDGMPLYYWQNDAKAGDATGEGVNGFSVAKVSGAAPAASDSGKPGY
jgi:predicted lipoprotein with Yx(FWY)xxD motif